MDLLNCIIENIISIGLAMDIAGAILIYRHGLPNRVSINNTNERPLESFEEELRERGQLNPDYVISKRFSKIGIILLAGGFFLQFIGSLL